MTPAEDANEVSELRNQVARLTSVIASLEQESADYKAKGIQVDHLICRLSRLCFAGLDGPQVKGDRTHFVEAAAKHVDQDVLIDEPQEGGFCFRQSTSAQSIEWEEMDTRMIAYASKWSAVDEPLFSPAWPGRIKERYSRLHCLPARCLAELFGVLCLQHATAAVETSGEPLVSQDHTKRSSRYHDLCLQALEASYYLHSSSIECLRSLYLLAYVDIAVWVDSSRFKRGLGLLPVMMAILWNLRYNEDDSAHPLESPVETYERRALATAVVRLVWWYQPAYGRTSLFSYKSFHCLPPEYLSCEECPTEQKYEVFRATHSTLRATAIRTELACMANELGIDVLSGIVEPERVDAFISRLAEIRDGINQGDWRMIDAADAGPGHFAVPWQSLHWQERITRHYVFLWLNLLSFNVHQHFIFGSDQESVQYHRGKMVDVLRDMRAAGADCHGVVGPMPSVGFSCYNTLIGAALLLASFSASPPTCEEASFCRELIRDYIEHQTPSVLPPATRRLIRLVMFLLDTSPGGQRHKRQKKEQNRPPIRRTLELKPLSRNHTPSRTFTFEEFLHFPGEQDAEPLKRRHAFGHSE